MLNISAGDKSRYWLIDKWAAVAKHFLLRNFQVIVTYHPKDRKTADKLIRECPDLTLFHSSTIRDIIALVSRVDLVVTPDTSIVHIASAFNIPQVALFPDVDWNFYKFHPLSRKNAVLRPKPGGVIADISTEEVIDNISNLTT